MERFSSRKLAAVIPFYYLKNSEQFRTKNISFRYNLKPVLNPCRTPKSSVLDLSFGDFAIFLAVFKVLVIFRDFPFFVQF